MVVSTPKAAKKRSGEIGKQIRGILGVEVGFGRPVNDGGRAGWRELQAGRISHAGSGLRLPLA